MTFGESVTVNTSGGTPTLTLETGTTDRTASYTSGTGTSTLTFSYTVQAGDTSADLDYVGTGSLSAAGGTIRDAAGNNAALTLPSPGAAGSLGANQNIVIDTTAPTVTITQAGGQLDPTNTSPINFAVTFSEPVTGFVNADVTLGGTALPTTAVVTGSSTTYNVAVSGMTGNGTVIISLAAGVAQDAAGNTSAASTNTDNTVTYDTTAPTVTGVTSTGNGSYRATQTILIQVTFGESVTVNTSGGTPTLTLETGTTDRAASYTSRTGTSTLTFTYTVQAGDTSADLDYVGTGSLSAAGGTIRDAAGNNAALTLPSPGAAGSGGQPEHRDRHHRAWGHHHPGRGAARSHQHLAHQLRRDLQRAGHRVRQRGRDPGRHGSPHHGRRHRIEHHL